MMVLLFRIFSEHRLPSHASLPNHVIWLKLLGATQITEATNHFWVGGNDPFPAIYDIYLKLVAIASIHVITVYNQRLR